MNPVNQIVAITLMNLRSIPGRLGASFVICIGIAGVVAVLITVLAMATGLERTVSSTGQADRAIVMRTGAQAEPLSTLSREALLVIESAPGIANDGFGPAVAAEVVLSVNLPRASDDQMAAVAVRGITEASVRLRPEVTIASGRMATAGLREVAVGRALAAELSNAQLGDSLSFHGGPWRIVGVFESGGDAHESELWVDANTLMSAANRTVFNSATVRLTEPGSLDALTKALEEDPQLRVEVQRESDYYLSQSKGSAQLIAFVAQAVAGIMAIGALLGALNTMYTAVATRTVEIATLRAIGFGALPVVASVLAEAVILALCGAGLGASIAWLLFNGNAIATGSALSQIALRLHIGADLIAIGVVWALVIGVIGGLPPAIRAARQSIAEGIRAQ